MSEKAGVISDWYELVSGGNLEQGDIIEQCPVLRPPKDMDWHVDQPDFSGEILVAPTDVVVASQSCDIAARQKTDIWLVVLCPIWALSAAARANPFLASSHGKEECRRGNLPGYHMIAGCNHQQWKREVSIVSFREIWSLPLHFVRKLAASRELRPRMRPPYREHLSQALARYFMRVGLPSEVPAFTTTDDKDETKAMKALRRLDEKTRQRVIRSWGPPPT